MIFLKVICDNLFFYSFLFVFDQQVTKTINKDMKTNKTKQNNRQNKKTMDFKTLSDFYKDFLKPLFVFSFLHVFVRFRFFFVFLLFLFVFDQQVTKTIDI